MSFEDEVYSLKQKLKSGLPGREAQYLMAPLLRKTFEDYIIEFPDHRSSAVMILIFPDNSGIANTILIERNKGTHVHSGQIGLPGGKLESGETMEQAALRETEEEIGVAVNDIEIIGSLTSLFIPASRFIVAPFIGVVNKVPSFILSPDEVFSVLQLSLTDLLKLPLLEKEFDTSYGKINAPYFEIKSHAVWGATAMILSEFREMLKR